MNGIGKQPGREAEKDGENRVPVSVDGVCDIAFQPKIAEIEVGDAVGTDDVAGIEGLNKAEDQDGPNADYLEAGSWRNRLKWVLWNG